MSTVNENAEPCNMSVGGLTLWNYANPLCKDLAAPGFVCKAEAQCQAAPTLCVQSMSQYFQYIQENDTCENSEAFNTIWSRNIKDHSDCKQDELRTYLVEEKKYPECHKLAIQSLAQYYVPAKNCTNCPSEN